MFNEYYSNGKLLLTGEYVVLDGYEGLALPTIYGQKLLVKTTAEKIINWTSYDYNNSVWFKNSYSIDNNGDIIWAFGMRISERYQVTNKTKNILILSGEKKK